MEYEEGDFVLCTVERIEKTIVFVILEDGKEGTIVTSEIAAGRIRNIRDYVVPKKKIVCKVLRVLPNTIELSLRRVSQKETKEVLNEYKQEKSYESILKKIIGENAEDIIKEIKKKGRIYDIFSDLKENSKEIQKIIGKDNLDRITEVIGNQKEKIVYLKKEFILKTKNPDGLSLIKEVLNIKDSEIKYISAGKYSIKIESNDLKSGDQKIKEIFEDLEKKAKKIGFEFKPLEK